MAQVRFSNNGYDYFDEMLVLFSSDKTHNLLLDYVAKDLSMLPGLLEQYVSKKINIDTFELTDYIYSATDIKEIEQTLVSFHPYYEQEFKNVFINAVGNFINHSLRHLLYKHKSRKYVYDRDPYIEIFKGLTAPLSFTLDTYPDEFYSKYRKLLRIPDDSQFAILLDAGVSYPSAQGFEGELKAHDAIRKMLFWLLDITAPSIGVLPMSQRIRLYSNIDKSHPRDVMGVTKRLTLSPTYLIRDDWENDSEDDVDDNLEDNVVNDELADNREKRNRFRVEDRFELLRKFDFYVDYENIPTEIIDSLGDVTKHISGLSTAETFEEYDVNNLYQLLYLEIMMMIQNGTIIKRCKHCGMYFVVVTRKREYCDRVADGERRPCSAIGRSRSYQKSIKEDPSLEMYNRAYKTHHARQIKGKMEQNDFFRWCNEAKAMLEKVRTGDLDISVFEDWLKK